MVKGRFNSICISEDSFVAQVTHLGFQVRLGLVPGVKMFNTGKSAIITAY